MSIHDFNERFKTEIPEDSQYDTISGFLHTLTERIPELNEEVRYENICFIIVKKNERRIRQVKIKIGPKEIVKNDEQ